MRQASNWHITCHSTLTESIFRIEPLHEQRNCIIGWSGGGVFYLLYSDLSCCWRLDVRFSQLSWYTKSSLQAAELMALGLIEVPMPGFLHSCSTVSSLAGHQRMEPRTWVRLNWVVLGSLGLCSSFQAVCEELHCVINEFFILFILLSAIQGQVLLWARLLRAPHAATFLWWNAERCYGRLLFWAIVTNSAEYWLLTKWSGSNNLVGLTSEAKQ